MPSFDSILLITGTIDNWNPARWDQWRRQGGRGAVAPNVEKDGPRNSSKFDEKTGGVGTHLRCEKIINNNIFNVTVLFCTVFLLRGCYSELRNQRSTAFYCRNERNKPFIYLDLSL